MKLIKQKYYTDCGVAAFAMITNITYHQAMKTLHPKRFWWFSDATTTFGQIMEALDVMKITYTARDDLSFEEFLLLNKKAIIAVKSNYRGKDANHAIVWDAESKQILDPSKYQKYNMEYCHKNFICAIILDN